MTIAGTRNPGELAELLASLQRKNVQLWIDEGDLHYRAVPGSVTTQEREALRAFKDQIVNGARDGTVEVVMAPLTVVAPVTVQQRIWLDRVLGGHLQSRLAPILWHIDGSLNVGAMQRSLREVVSRHGSLRTRIIQLRDEPKQWIDELREQYLEVLDFTAMPEIEINAKLKSTVDELCDHDCDLTVGPLFVGRLIKLAEKEHVLLIAIHHIINDGSTLALLFRELWSQYRAVVRGQSSPVSAAPMQSSDYARWQQTMHGAWKERHRPYWLEHLSGAVAICWPNIATRSTCAPGLGCVQTPLEQVLTKGLREAAKHARTLPAMVLIAVFAAVVTRQCGQRDFVITTTVHGRDLPGHEDIASYCSHSIYLRVQLRGDECFYDLLRHVSDEFLRAMEHKDFGGIVEELPQFRAGTLFQWLPWPGHDELDATDANGEANLGLKVKPFELPFQFKWDAYFPDIYDMVWTCNNTKDGVLLRVFYRSEVFAAAAISQFVSEFHATAKRLARNIYDRVVADRSF